MNYVFLGSYFPKDKFVAMEFYSWSRKFETKIV